jgi:hypothetical protein
MISTLHLPQLIQPFAPACPEGASVLLDIARDLSQRSITETADELLTHFSEEPLVAYALLLAAERHQGQVYLRPFGPVPYLYHPLDVSWCITYALEVNNSLAATLGLWHDLIEDQKISAQELRAYLETVRSREGQRYPPELDEQIIIMLTALSRPEENEKASEYYAGLAQAPEFARIVKAADLICNTSSLKAHLQTWYSAPNPEQPPRPHLIAKYVTQADRFVLNQPAFTTLEYYPLIHSTLLGILQDLIRFLNQEYPAQASLIEEISLRRYRTSYKFSANRILKLSSV